MYENIQEQAKMAVEQLLEVSNLEENDIFVIGCSSSEIMGDTIGHGSTFEVAKAIFDGVYPILKAKNIFLAAQCCEHLNRAIIIERAAAKLYGYEIVSVVPQPKAGGSFATAAYAGFSDPVAVETIKASAGIDIGGTLIGMHLKNVAVPIRLDIKRIGQANILCAKTRPKYIGGGRAVYENKKS
ncbi:MAG: TIGR01440 family protein [Oscillospiraceae bacterium]